MQPLRFRVLRPLSVGGRIAATGEIIKLPAPVADEWTASGHLKPIDVPAEVAADVPPDH